MDGAQCQSSQQGGPVADPPTDADTASRGQQGAEPTRAELLVRVAYLENKLVTLPAIEQVKGALMVTYGLSADAAFNLLRFHSQNRNVKVRAIAGQLTTLMSTSSSSTEAIARFDRLLDEVAESLQSSVILDERERLAQAASASAAVAAWPQIPAAELPAVMLRAVATAPPGITIVGNSLDMPLVYANDAFTEMTGYPVKEILGRNCRFLQGAGTDSGDIRRLSNAIHARKDFSVVMRNYRSDGAPFWNEVSVSPIRDGSERITHYIGTQIDITERVGRLQTFAAQAS